MPGSPIPCTEISHRSSYIKEDGTGQRGRRDGTGTGRDSDQVQVQGQENVSRRANAPNQLRLGGLERERQRKTDWGG